MLENRLAIRIGLLAAGLSVFFLCFAVASMTRPLASPDETAHLDYAVEVWHGHLPVFERGLELKPPGASVPPVQLEWQHPPLFYAIVSPIAGPIVDAGYWRVATMAVRTFNAIVSVVIMLVVAWTTWLIPGRDRVARAITAAAVTATISVFVGIGGSAYSDTLVTLMSALAVGIAFVAVTRGVTWRLLTIACGVAAAGSLSRAEFLLPFPVLLAGLGLGIFLHPAPRARWLQSRWAVAGCAIVLPIISAGLASGWFYLRNHRLSGNFEGTHLAWAQAHLRQHTRTLMQTLKNLDVQHAQYWLLRHPGDGRTHNTIQQLNVDHAIMVPVFFGVVVAGVLTWLREVIRSLRRRDWVQLSLIGLITMLMVLTLASEVRYTMGGGGASSRYLLPALVPIVLLLTGGLRLVPRITRPYLLAAYLLTCHALFAYWIYDHAHAPGTTPSSVPWLLVAVLPPIILVLSLVVCAAVRSAQRDPSETPPSNQVVAQPVVAAV